MVGSKDDITQRVENIRAQVNATDSTYEKEKLEERLGKLAGGVAVIRVGGSSEVGVNIVRKAMHIPAVAIINNSGKEGAVYCGKMLETATADSKYGYDAATDSWADLHELG